MIDNFIIINYKYKISKIIYMGIYALKSVDYIFNLDVIDTFFVFKRCVYRCRSPPTINLIFLKFELIGGNHG